MFIEETLYAEIVQSMPISCVDLVDAFEELATFDWFFSFGKGQRLHSITTLFKVVVDSRGVIALDEQSHETRWDSPQNWVQTDLDPMMLEGISTVFPK